MGAEKLCGKLSRSDSVVMWLRQQQVEHQGEASGFEGTVLHCGLDLFQLAAASNTSIAGVAGFRTCARCNTKCHREPPGF